MSPGTPPAAYASPSATKPTSDTVTMIPDANPQRPTSQRLLNSSTNKNGSAPNPVAIAVTSPARKTRTTLSTIAPCCS